jgi:hypothetical protein
MSKILAAILALVSILLTSCIYDPDGYIKRAGNKRVSASNPYAKKRMPIQNKKYIQKAKRNIIQNDYDDDYEDDEYDQDPRLINRRLYMQMVAQEQAKKKQNYRRDNDLRELELEEREKQATQKIVNANQEAQKLKKELQVELDNIKSVLNETKEQMASMKCFNKPKDVNYSEIKTISENKNIKLDKKVSTATKTQTNPSVKKETVKTQPLKDITNK